MGKLTGKWQPEPKTVKPDVLLMLNLTQSDEASWGQQKSSSTLSCKKIAAKYGNLLSPFHEYLFIVSPSQKQYILKIFTYAFRKMVTIKSSKLEQRPAK